LHLSIELSNKYKIIITAFSCNENIGLKQICEGRFEWKLTKELWRHFREMTTALYRNGTHGHQYLDSEVNYFNSHTHHIDVTSLQVILSLEEYPFDFWKDHFDLYNDSSNK
jgi:hypothetical protein